MSGHVWVSAAEAFVCVGLCVCVERVGRAQAGTGVMSPLSLKKAHRMPVLGIEVRCEK